ncbi:hypothetical protein WMF28_06715 [Sorangium sp. So ce590]|uniref:hypothetical protein n=1 Tax=Sorangium sp. So ce590 TaxID=3133317 RepID=UPI003F627E94
MRPWLLLIAACALCACSDDTRPPPRDPGNDAGDSGTSGAGPQPDAGDQTDAGGQTDAGPDAASPTSPLERFPELPRPPAGRLPDDLKPPVR